ncbi:MAG: hypothetical protein HQL74_14875 [Magnetococcales bacterium]|nr:hypothetical protein [Magnetococcales bacterium]
MANYKIYGNDHFRARIYIEAYILEIDYVYRENCWSWQKETQEERYDSLDYEYSRIISCTGLLQNSFFAIIDDETKTKSNKVSLLIDCNECVNDYDEFLKINHNSHIKNSGGYSDDVFDSKICDDAKELNDFFVNVKKIILDNPPPIKMTYIEQSEYDTGNYWIIWCTIPKKYLYRLKTDIFLHKLIKYFLM